MSDKVIVITGSTRGIGFGLAYAFLDLGCSVVVSGRSKEAVDIAVETLQVQHESKQVLGFACDVTRIEQIQMLWDQSVKRFRRMNPSKIRKPRRS